MRNVSTDREYAAQLRDDLIKEAVATLVVGLNCEFNRQAAWQAAHDENYDDLSEPISGDELISREFGNWTPGDEAEAIRNKARLIGWRLWANGGTRLMLKVSDLVWDQLVKADADDGRMMNWLDHWFDGIGEPTKDVWGA